MAAWFSENLATIIICAILVVIVALAVRSIVKNRRAGKTSCGCGCAGCAMSGSCHKAEEHHRTPPH